MKNSTDCLITQHYDPGQEMQLMTGHAQNKNKKLFISSGYTKAHNN